MTEKVRAKYNRTLTLSEAEMQRYRKRLLQLQKPAPLRRILNRTLCQDLLEALPHLPHAFADLMILDPPYNRYKEYNQRRFKRRTDDDYLEWMNSWLSQLVPLLKPTASVYICCDWKTSPLAYQTAQRYFLIQNRITWERDKGRGAKSNWKNCSEDIWFCTLSNEYTFNIEAVKLKRRVIAPYTHPNGDPKDWQRSEDGDYRLTHPSNLWTDICIPFWSMSENTDHPTQKPEKLIAKLILAGSQPGDVVLDPFLGSGTTSVTAKKLGRKFVGIEADESYCCLAEKRLHLAETDKNIQGYQDGVFWERNSMKDRKKDKKHNGS